MADRIQSGGSMSEEDAEFLKECELRDSPFADLELNLWRPVDVSNPSPILNRK
jgi:1,4-alpha-glucan branching enzyme